MLKKTLILMLILVLFLAACASDDADTAGIAVDEGLKDAVVENYAAGAHASYVKSLNSAQSLDAAIDRFLAMRRHRLGYEDAAKG